LKFCHSGNLPPIVACRGSTGGVAGGVHWQRQMTLCGSRNVASALFRGSELGAFGTGGVRNWGHNRAVKTIRLVCLVCLSVCNVGVLWPNGWMDQDETWHAGRLRYRPHCVRWGTQLHLPKGVLQPPIFGPCLLSPNGYMD